jgi:glycosyltransferase 2 family protein
MVVPMREWMPLQTGRGRRNWLGWGLALVILVTLALVLDLHKVLDVLSQAHPAAVLGLLILLTFDRLLMAWKWSILLRVIGVRIPLLQITRYYYQGSLTGIFLPSSIGGDLLRATWVAQASGVKHGVFASLLMEKLVGFLSAMIWAIAGAVVFASYRYGELLQGWLTLGAAALAVVVATFVLSLHPLVHAFVLNVLGRFRSARVVRLLHRLYEAYTHFSRAKGPLTLNVLLTLAEHGLQIVAFLLLARSLGVDADAILLLAMTAVQFLVFRIPISPDGWGIGELSAIGLYGLIGIGPEAAFTMMFFNHILVTIACLPGLWFLVQGAPAPSPAVSSE